MKQTSEFEHRIGKLIEASIATQQSIIGQEDWIANGRADRRRWRQTQERSRISVSPAKGTARIHERHILIGHIRSELVEREIFHD